MRTHEFFQLIIYFAVLFGSGPFLGWYIAKVFTESKPFTFLVSVERLLYRSAGIDEKTEMHWSHYLICLILFNVLGIVIVFGLQIFQGTLPLNPEHFSNVNPLLAFNTAVSFVTNTNWQAYSGEGILGYFVEMVGLTVQNFLSAATGIAVMVALARGIVRKKTGVIGNFWVDMVRTTLYILIPLSFIFSLILIGQGVVQSFSAYHHVTMLNGAQQVIPSGPAASQIAIKQLGTNGGGFFGVNSAHPFENPTPFSNFLEMLAILLIPVAQVFAFGRLIQNKKHGYALIAVMAFFLLSGFAVSWYSEIVNAHTIGVQALMEGKETRFGVMNSILWSVTTTAASNGSINAMVDSMSPMSIFVALFNIMLGEIVFGGVGSGLYGMILYVLLTIFLVGLMVGRTPEYMGKKIESREIRWTMIGLLVPSIVILVGAAIAIVSPTALSSILNKGPHGLSEIVYAFTSAAGNNGSALAGLSVNTPFFNVALAIAMLFGRFGVIIPVLVIAGSLVRKSTAAENEGTFHADNTLFAMVLLFSIIIVGALVFAPVLLLGPVIEQVLINNGMLL